MTKIKAPAVQPMSRPINVESPTTEKPASVTLAPAAPAAPGGDLFSGEPSHQSTSAPVTTSPTAAGGALGAQMAALQGTPIEQLGAAANDDKLRLDQGFISPYFASDKTKMVSEMKDPLILIQDNIERMDDLVPLLEAVVGTGKPLLIIAGDIKEDVVAALVVNQMRGVLDMCVIQAPGSGDARKAMLKDMAERTGATLHSDVKNITLEELGTAKTVRIDKTSTSITGLGLE